MATELGLAADLFDPARLRLAREASGLTQTELAGRVGVTPGAISQFERSYARPNPATLRELAFALGFPPGFLVTSEPWQAVELPQAFFRKLASTSRREQVEACATATLLQLFVQTLERYVDLPHLDLDLHPVGADDDRAAVQAAASALRESWGLGTDPLPDVVHQVEAHGVPVARVSDVADKVDGFSCLSYDRPVVLLGKHKGDRARSRFDAAHELGHLVMHHEFAGSHKVREQQAQVFASAFLAPPDTIRGQLPARLDAGVLLGLKRKWGMSMQALLMTSRDAGVMPEHTYRRAMIQFGKSNWRQNEPGYLGEPEQPQMLRRAVALLDEAGISFDCLLAVKDLPAQRVRAFLPEDSPDRLKVKLDQ
jgi:Zn-dependent peptidase ImmA (M78 family)/transcriptional regulator with XRE-family HTH domain